MVISTPQRTANGMVVAAAAHAFVFALLVFFTRTASQHDPGNATAVLSQTLTWLGDGPGGGRGGSGARQPDPARSLRRIGRDNRSVPAPAPAPTTPLTDAVVEPDPVVRVAIPVTPLGDGAESEIGVIGAIPIFSSSRGPGDGGGAGSGRNGGNGPGDGRGSGIGGRENGIGVGPGGSGSNVTHPVAIHMERPNYTTDAMRARVQGTVSVECVVRPNGTCSDIRVVRSLDRAFGLDEEAKRAAALWRFKPGTRFGQPVPVSVRIELEFTLR